jgi:isoquinoline 1-oxidoreductase subunit beta
VYHAQLEPVNAVVSVNEAGDGAEVWMGTQGQTIIAGALAGFLKTQPQNIKVHQHFWAGASAAAPMRIWRSTVRRSRGR